EPSAESCWRAPRASWAPRTRSPSGCPCSMRSGVCLTPTPSPSGSSDCWQRCSIGWVCESSDTAAHHRGPARRAPTFRHACSACVGMRVISLLPAATEIVAALGAGGRLVGVTHECDYPPEVRVLPRVTRSRLDPDLSSGEIDRALAAAKHEGAATVEVDVGVVGRLRPDVIIAQAICDVCAVG